MNPQYKFLLSTGKFAMVDSVFENGEQLGGAVALDRGFSIPVGSSGYLSYFFIKENPFIFHETTFTGQMLKVDLNVVYTNYSQLVDIPTIVEMQRYSNGVFIGSGLRPTSQSYNDSISGTTLTRRYSVEYRFTKDDIVNKWYYQFYIQLRNQRKITALVEITTTYFLFQKDIVQQVAPIYKDDLAKDYELETNQRFYRSKLSGKLSFLGNDFILINNAPFDTTFSLYIQQSNDLGLTYNDFFAGKFMKTDCTFNIDNKKITVQPDVLDEYNEVLAGLEKEYNLIALAPQIERLHIKKRPLIQVYIPGDSIVSCFLGGSYWEQDAEATTDRRRLVRDFHFALCNMLKEMNITVNGTPTEINGLYTGRMTFANNGTYSGNLSSDSSNGYYVYVETKIDMQNWWNWGYVLCEIRRRSDNMALFRYENSTPGEIGFDNMDFELSAVPDSGATGKATAEMATYRVYARYLLDVTTIRGVNTYELPSDDIVDYNRNYRRAIGYAIDIAYISNNSSTRPTEWGRRDDGTYFEPPYSFYGQKYYPIARSTWRYASIWFAFVYGDEWLEEDGRKTYILRDAFPVASCINILLQQFAPNIRHEATPEYSQFLYGSTNPITYQAFTLYVTQKSNILVGDYQQPAQKAPTTLQQFTNMLRDCYRCFWYIEDGKFKIEHISWFHNGGSYAGSPVIGLDLTTIYNVRNGKKWGFATSEYSFDKVDMAERYQFAWMDDVTTAFQGLPIEVKSKYVTAGKIEDVNVSNFTSDIDMMMLAPGDMSKDGFALFSAVTVNALVNPDDGYFNGASWDDNETRGYATPYYDIRPEFKGLSAILHGYVYPQRKGSFNIQFFNESGNKTGGIVNVDNPTSVSHSFSANVYIPTDATQFSMWCDGAMYFRVSKLEIPTSYELPFIQREINGVNYFLQNGYLAFVNLQPNYYVYDLPARDVEINGSYIYVQGIERKKKQTLNFPVPNDINPVQLIKTYIGSGQIDKMSVDLCSLSAKTTLKYDTE